MVNNDSRYNTPMSTMLDALLAAYLGAPSIWTPGALFAESGASADAGAMPLVAAYGIAPYGLTLHTPQPRILDVLLPAPAALRLALPHLYAAETPRGPLIVAWAGPQTIIGIVPPGGGLALRFADGPEADFRAPFWVSADPAAPDALALAMGRGGHFILAYAVGDSAVESASAAARTALLDPNVWTTFRA
jgi:hypothetical protein